MWKKIFSRLIAVLQSDEAALLMGVLLVYGSIRLALELWDVLAAGVR